MFKSFEEKNIPGIPASLFPRRVATAAFASAVATMAVLPLSAGAQVGMTDGSGVQEDNANGLIDTQSAGGQSSQNGNASYGHEPIINNGVITIPVKIVGDDQLEQPEDKSDKKLVETTENATKKEDSNLGDDRFHKPATNGSAASSKATPLKGEADVPNSKQLVGVEVYDPRKTLVLNSAVPQSVVESASMFIDGIQGHSERLQTKANHLWIDGVASYSRGRDDAYGAGGRHKNGFKSRKAGFVAGYDVDLRDDLVAGAAVSWIRSKYNSKGFANVENKADTYGIALYSDWQTTEKLKLSALAGWQRTKGKIRMEEKEYTNESLSTVKAYNHTESRARTNAFVGSLRAAYDVPVEALTVTPHVGLDLIHAKTRPMDIRRNGDFIGKAHFKSHTTWELPLGVRFSSVLDKDGWLIKPEADLTYTTVFGDRRMKFDVIKKSGEISSYDVEFINSNRIGAAVGVSFDNKRDKLFGLHYKVERSDNGLDHQFKLEFVKRF